MNRPPYDLAFYVPLPQGDLSELERRLDALAALGVERIGTDGFSGWKDDRVVARYQEAFSSRGMRVASVHAFGLMYGPGRAAESIGEAKRFVDIAAAWGSPSTVWHYRWLRQADGGYFAHSTEMDRLGPSTLDGLMAEVLSGLAPYAATKGVGVNLENVPLVSWSRDMDGLLSFLRAQNQPSLGLILDSGHAHANGLDVAAVIRRAGGLLRDTHFHDNLGPRNFDFNKPGTQEDVHAVDLHMPVGMGTINWIEVVRALWAVDFRGPVVFEGPGIKGHPRQDVETWARWVDLTVRNWRALEEAAACLPDPAWLKP